MAQGNLGGASPRRTAIVVCAGVGDNANGQAAARTMQGLVRHGGFSSATQRIDAYPSGLEQTQDLYGYTLTAPDGSEVDLYEFWWADLSRFPAAMRLYLVALYGLVLQLPATGIAALRGGGPLTAAPATEDRAPWSVRPIAFLEWLLAVPLVLVSVLEAALVGGFAAVAWANSQFASAPKAASGVVLTAYGTAVLVAGSLWLREYRCGRGRYLAVPVGWALFLAAAAVTTWRGVHDHSLLAGLADSLLVMVAYVVRSIWIVAGVTIVVLLFGLVASRPWRTRRNETFTVVTAVATSTAGFAILTGALLAAGGAAVRGLAPAWEKPKRVPWCLPDATAWTPGRCHGSATQDPWHWGLDLYTLLFTPLVWVFVIALVAVVYTAGACSTASFRVLWWRLGRAGSGTARRGIAGLDSALASGRLLVVVGASLALAGAMIVIIWLPVLTWIPRADGGKHGVAPGITALIGGFIVAGLAATRALNFTVSAIRENSPGNETGRLILDKAYDVATFFRERGRSSRSVQEPPESARERILHRYWALLDHLAPPTGDGRYARIVFFAHSQGAVLTATALREPLPGGTSVDLITFGCPLRQLYLRRFPSQFHWVEAMRGNPRVFAQGVTDSWTNITGCADPIGGTLFHDPPPEWWNAPNPWNDTIAGLPVAEVPVIGGHGAYWKCAPVFQLLGRTASQA
jgi:hypothetical protein